MKYKPFRNESYNSHDISYPGECPRFNEEATLYIHLSGSQVCKHDLQPTFMPHLRECSLLNEKNDKNTACMFSCPIFEAYMKSHDY